MFFQQLKRLHETVLGTAPGGETSFGLGAFASAAAVAVMIPMDTVKTRLVTQLATDPRAYKGVRDCFLRVLHEEGLGAFYRSLPPRLMSVVPMIAIQFGAYEMLKARFVAENREKRRAAAAKLRQRGTVGC
jgi:solute carrier family 25 S-adenosylmethionine transporter 26